MSNETYRVNYYAPKFGFVGWEVFVGYDFPVMQDCIRIAISQMSKQIEEEVDYEVLKL